MTAEERLSRASASFDLHIAQAMAAGIDMLRDHGATDDEIDTFIHWKSEELAAWKAKTLADVRRWFEHGENMPTTTLQ